MKISRINLNSSSSFSSSMIPTEKHEDFSAFDNLFSMRHELPNIYPSKIRIVNELDDSADKKVGLNDVYLAIVKCPICNFDIEVYSRSGDSEDYETCNMICPVCDEKFGENEIRAVRYSSYPILQKRIWNMQKQKFLNVGWEMHQCKKDSWSNAPLKDSEYSLSSDEFLSDSEDIISNASDITGAKDISIKKSSEVIDAPDIGDEQNIQERINKAAFSQELLMSIIFSE